MKSCLSASGVSFKNKINFKKKKSQFSSDTLKICSVGILGKWSKVLYTIHNQKDSEKICGTTPFFPLSITVPGCILCFPFTFIYNSFPVCFLQSLEYVLTALLKNFSVTDDMMIEFDFFQMFLKIQGLLKMCLGEQKIKKYHKKLLQDKKFN